MGKNKLIIFITTWVVILLLGTTGVHAEEDLRVLKLETYLAKVNSPMQGFESILVETADKYNLDWTLLAAIAGTESTFGKRMPYQCINPYGWGIYGDNKICFASFQEAIEKVGEGIGTKYNTGSIETIAKKYNSANTTKWLASTKFFMNKIKNEDPAVRKLPIKL